MASQSSKRTRKPGRKRARSVEGRKPAARSRTGAAKSAEPSARSARPFTIRTSTGKEFQCPGSATLPSLAMSWSYAVRKRQRWASTTDPRRELASRAARDLATLGVTETILAEIARADFVEVGSVYSNERVGWEWRIFPWEYVLSAATAALRQDRRVTVVRNLASRQKRRPVADGGKVLFVQSAPGAIGERYSFDSEFKILDARLPASRRIFDPTLADLRKEVQQYQPAVIHLAGVDAREGAALLGSEDEPHDGYYLTDDNGQPVAVGAEELAEALNSGKRSPRLVTFGIYSSGPRLAALAVGLGAGAAVGFQDEIDDALAEMFYANFYRAWEPSQHDVLGSFDLAWRTLREHRGSLRGSGVILWSARSLVDPASTTIQRRRKRSVESRSIDTLHDSIEKSRRVVLKFPSGKGRTLHDILSVSIKPTSELNYSLLHNGRDLFERFVVRKSEEGLLRNVRLDVVLHVGSHAFPYRASFDLSEPVTPLAHRVRVPLTWEFVRGLRESVRTTLYVAVSHDDSTIVETTYPVTIVPTEAWIDNGKNGLWLPSFVLPRDPAVATILSDARRYLRALVDDAAAGFDGYQSVDPDAEDPSEGVDLQVRALWSAILNEHGLGYINPPPAYAESTQRLRRPTDVIESGSGTCIDLALLLASCLEYIDIYPVLFLLQGHAFAGYWRSMDDHDAFIEAYHETLPSSPDDDQTRASRTMTQEVPWVSGSDAYEEIVQMVRDYRIVPLETVSLTQHEGYYEAMDKGIDNLRAKKEFEALVDVARARWEPVTPLPL